MSADDAGAPSALAAWERLDDDELEVSDRAVLASGSRRHRLARGTSLAQARRETVLLVARGRVALVARDAGGHERTLERLEPGALLLGDELSASATSGELRLEALASAEIFEVDVDVARSTADPGRERRLWRFFRRIAARRAVTHGAARLGHAQERRLLGHALVSLLLITVLYTVTLWALPLLTELLPEGSAFVSVPLQLVFLAATLHYMRGSGLEAAAFGLTPKDAGTHARGALLFTLPLLALVVALKALAVKVVDPGSGRPVFEIGRFLDELGVFGYTLFVGVYLVFVVVQEVVVRGGVHSALGRLLCGPRGRAWAVLLSNLLFGVTHLHLSGWLAVGSFFVGLGWGWLYERQGSLVGVTVSHALLGVLAFFVVGVEAA